MKQLCKMVRVLMCLTLLVSVGCWASAAVTGTEAAKEDAHVDRSDGKVSIRGTITPADNAPVAEQQPKGQPAVQPAVQPAAQPRPRPNYEASYQPSPHFPRNQILSYGGRTLIQNSAGSVITDSDGSSLLFQGSDSDSDEDSLENRYNSHSISAHSNNVVINGNTYSGGDNVIINGGSTVRIVNGVLELTEAGRTYRFTPRAKDVVTREQSNINGEQVTVFYEHGGIRIERSNGAVIAYGINGEGLFMGDRESYANRKKILEDIPRQTAAIQKHVQDELARVGLELERTLGNLHF